MKFIYLWICILNLCIYQVQSVTIVPLTRQIQWRLQNNNGTIYELVNTPSGIYTDLTTLGILKEDIFYRFNDQNYRFVANETWIYFVTFKVEEEFINSVGKELILHGLDGYAYIYLNNKYIGLATNSFVRYRYDITQYLKVSQNVLKIAFLSPIETADALSSRALHPVPPECVPLSYKGECHVNFLRRMQASFAWDWGPAFPSVGVWQDVEIVGYNDDILIRDITVATSPQTNYWDVQIKVYVEASSRLTRNLNGVLQAALVTSSEKVITVVQNVVYDASAPRKENNYTVQLNVPKQQVELWWPNGYGDQPLYNLTATVSTSTSSFSKTIAIGFRTIELRQDTMDPKDPEKGASFYFTVNDVPVFAKGSNLVPTDVLPERASDENTIKHLLLSSKLANMNMLRVWGGGLYLSDYFYQLADQYGIMIWQDMMFACNMYPVNEEFIESVSTEVYQQVRRLQYHPSVAVWAGNNENEAALSGNWYGTSSNYSLYKSEYVTLYVTTIKPIVQAIDGTRAYLESSPTNGIQSEEEGYVASNPYNPNYGDIHFYDYLSNSWVIDNYPFTRFCSEYGFQAFPSKSTLQNVSIASDLASLNSKFLQSRQHLGAGYLYLTYLLAFHFSLPPLTNMDSIIYFSQINQAWSIKSQTEWYRKWRNNTNPANGNGNTMGALYWQLNDVWQAPTWSSIEYGGKWKLLHYYAVKFFAPVLITADLSTNSQITINLISDLLYDIPQATLRTDVYKWDTLKPVYTKSEQVFVKKAAAQQLKSTTVEKYIDSAPGCNSNTVGQNHIEGQNCFLKLTLLLNNGIILSENHLFPIAFQDANGLQNANITIKVDNLKSKECKITLTTDGIALFVWLDVGVQKAQFSDNGFIMTETQKDILFLSDEVKCEDVEKLLQISILDRTRVRKASALMSFTTKSVLSTIETFGDQLGLNNG